MTTHTNQHQTSAVAKEVRSIAKKLGLLLALFAVLVSALITMGSTAGGAVAGASSRSWGWAQWDHFGWVLLGIFASLALWGIIAFLRPTPNTAKVTSQSTSSFALADRKDGITDGAQ